MGASSLIPAPLEENSVPGGDVSADGRYRVFRVEDEARLVAVGGRHGGRQSATPDEIVGGRLGLRRGPLGLVAPPAAVVEEALGRLVPVAAAHREDPHFRCEGGFLADLVLDAFHPMVVPFQTP